MKVYTITNEKGIIVLKTTDIIKAIHRALNPGYKLSQTNG